MLAAGRLGAARLLPALWRSKLLIGYLALGVLAGGLVSFGDGAAVVANDLLLGVYAVVIWRVTRGEPTLAVPQPEERPARPRRDMVAVVATYLLVVGFTFWFWFGGGVTLDRTIVSLLRALSPDPVLAGRIGSAAVAGIELGLVLVLALGVLRFSPAAVCLRPRHLRLGVGLSAFGLGLGVLWILLAHGGPLRGVNPLVLPGVFFFQAFVNGIPEEFAFRGVILSRLQRLIGSPQNALVLSSVLFISSHAASTLAQGPRLPWWVLALRLVAGTQPTGIAWGYLCQRTRSIWPGAIWHTTSSALGPIFV